MHAQNNVALDSRQQSLVKISSLTATGNTEPLKIELHNGLNAGLSINEIKEALVQLYAYCGFPRSLNALNTFKTALEEREANCITDVFGKEIVVANNPPDKYEQGRRVLEQLTHTPQAKPAPGFGVFAPRIDAFLKEHLFADVFASDVLSYQQRELVTIAALASMTGVEGQLQAHIGIGKNTGISEDQLSEIAAIIDHTTSVTQGNTIRKIIALPIIPVLNAGLMVRIAEIEIEAGQLNTYNAILKENAAISVKTEPGVIAIFPTNIHENAAQVRVIEIYASKEAYQSHLQTAHFQHYKTTTSKMVKSLKLIEMDAIDKETMAGIFEKIK